MSLISVDYFVFINIAILGYYTLFKKFQWQYLLVVSVLAYVLMAAPVTIVYLLITIVTVYFAGRMIETGNKYKKPIFWITIAINVSLLVSLKYTNFFIGNINAAISFLDFESQIEAVNWTVSMGISYYTLSAIGYLSRIYWGAKLNASIGKVALFICFFPLVVSGPICKYEELEKSLFVQKEFIYRDYVFGAQRILWGIFKKLVVAERIAVVVNTIYDDPITYSGIFIVVAACGFLIQLYTDFSGCMDIVIGTAQCFQIVLPENFRAPFFSHSIQEYWQRWHITLGGWMKEHIMYPILKTEIWSSMRDVIKSRWGKKWAKKIPTYLAMLILWIVIGFWHGGGWQYIIFDGIYFGIIIIISDLAAPLYKRLNEFLHIQTDHFLWKIWQSVRTFLLVSIGLLAFSGDSLKEVIYIIQCAFSDLNVLKIFNYSLLSNLGLDVKDIVVCIIGIFIVFSVDALSEKHDVREWISSKPVFIRWNVWYLLLLSVIILGMYGSAYVESNFIYEQF